MQPTLDVAHSPRPRRVALALEYPLMQQGGTEVLVQELVKRLSTHYRIVLVSGDTNAGELPKEFSELLEAHIPWSPNPSTAQAGRAVAAALAQQRVELVHFHFGGTFVWASNRFWRCPVYHVAKKGIPC